MNDIFDSTFLIDLMKSPTNSKHETCYSLLDEIQMNGEPYSNYLLYAVFRSAIFNNLISSPST